MSGSGGVTLKYLSAAFAAALVVLACPQPSSADTFDDPGFATEVVATVPPYTLVGLAFAPDGRLFVWQKNGVIRIIKNGVMLSTPFADLSSHVNTFDDRGMWGLAFDPNFSSNGYVYVTYTYEGHGRPQRPGAKTGTADAARPPARESGRRVARGDRAHGDRQYAAVQRPARRGRLHSLRRRQPHDRRGAFPHRWHVAPRSR